MSESERKNEEVGSKQTAPPRKKRPARVNKAAVLLGDPVIVFGGFLRAFSRRKR
jgi:hypothetical protein